MLTLPLRAKGVDARGNVFESPARTVTLSGYGAQVQIPSCLLKGQNIRLHNLISRREGDFRVVAAVSSLTEVSDDYGVECLKPDRDIWQIQFPLSAAVDAAGATALLQCRMCHTLVLDDLTIGELEVLRTAGVVAKSCPKICKAVTPWKYAEISVAENGLAEDGWMSAVAGLSKQRRHRRVYLQQPVTLRDADGRVETARTENVSRAGFCFTSEREYPADQEVLVFFSGDTMSRKPEISARIAWQQYFGRTNRKIYGMHCDRRAN
jgi:hypothetical protein